jgi:NAD(P)-dependent dehydrogenase (short-subunit alcohol dehydrogenase family)
MNYVKSLAKQLGPKGIRVNGVAPGPIWTPLQISGGAPMTKTGEVWRPGPPLDRPGQPAELGSIYVQLAAADASFATGQVYGARSMAPGLWAKSMAPPAARASLEREMHPSGIGPDDPARTASPCCRR